MKVHRTILLVIIALAIAGLIPSAYLAKEHLNPSTDSSFCDFNEVASCSVVNSSSFSKFLNVPVAIFGEVWFVFLGFFAASALRKGKRRKERENRHLFTSALLLWCALGILSVIYLVVAELILGAICPLCTIVHVIIIAVSILTFYIFKKSNSKINTKMLKKLKYWIAAVIFVNLAILIYFNVPALGGSTEPEQDYSNLAQCMTDNGVVMYGSFRCVVCARTRALFGDAFESVKEIECHPQGENAQTDLCLSKNIEATPTWVVEPNGPEGEETNRHVGFLSIEELREFSGCPASAEQ